MLVSFVNYSYAEYDGRAKCSRSSTNNSATCVLNCCCYSRHVMSMSTFLSNIVSLPCLFPLLITLMQNTMAEQNVPAQAPTRTDEQIISVDILRNTNFFRAFSASASVPAIYIQQFWNSMKYDEKTGVYCCQVDEQWFNLSTGLFRKALDITPVDPAHPFELPPTGDTVIEFVNQLGYPEPIEFEVDIIKKTENQAKMTKLSMEWKRLCKIKAAAPKIDSSDSTHLYSNPNTDPDRMP
ncbi:hypothetical protein Tco_1526530, partial [Tanacetum coccineum]